MQSNRRPQGRDTNWNNRDSREGQSRRFRGHDYERHSSERSDRSRFDREMDPAYYGGSSDLDTGSQDYSRERSRAGSYGGYEQQYSTGKSSSYGSDNTRQSGGYEQHYGPYDRHYGPTQAATTNQQRPSQDQSSAGRYSSQSYGQDYNHNSRQDFEPQLGYQSRDFSSSRSHGRYNEDDAYRGTQNAADQYEISGRMGYSSGDRSVSSYDRDRDRMGLSESLSDRLSPRQGYGSDQTWGRDQGRHYGKGPKGYRRSDDRLKEEISDALSRDSHIDASEIEVSIESGVVTLRGTVEDRRTKRLAEDCAAHIEGVSDVRNELRVESSENRSADSSTKASMTSTNGSEQTRKASSSKTSSDKIM
ncbi:MAG: BON domain-containing protein [Bdellovibrionaceae bacterium]|nr:BON domain-containing protein [Pseudobdellovibrionaceae bacterium]